MKHFSYLQLHMIRANAVNNTKGESAANAAILNELYENDMVLSEVQVGFINL